MLIDKGYHPCAVLPGYEMYYFTILGGLSQRSLSSIFNLHMKSNYIQFLVLWIWWPSLNNACNPQRYFAKSLKNNYAVAGLVTLGWEDMMAYVEAAEKKIAL